MDEVMNSASLDGVVKAFMLIKYIEERYDGKYVMRNSLRSVNHELEFSYEFEYAKEYYHRCGNKVRSNDGLEINEQTAGDMFFVGILQNKDMPDSQVLIEADLRCYDWTWDKVLILAHSYCYHTLFEKLMIYKLDHLACFAAPEELAKLALKYSLPSWMLSRGNLAQFEMLEKIAEKWPTAYGELYRKIAAKREI